jgi:glycosyltransferase involved in cell wall biosynthesis
MSLVGGERSGSGAVAAPEDPRPRDGAERGAHPPRPAATAGPGRTARPRAPGGAPSRPALRLVERRPLRVVDVALFYGERSGGIRTYLDAKAAYARRTGAFEHRLVVPGEFRFRPPSSQARTSDDVTTGPVCSLPSIRVARSNGYRWPIGTRRLVDLLRYLQPDVVLLHDPFWAPRAVCSVGAPVVMVHHGSLDLDAAGLPGPTRLYRPALGGWLRHAYSGADAVMSACDPLPDTGRQATLPLRFGLDSAFYPEGDEQRGDHVLYVGRLGREKGVFELLEAAALSDAPWPLWLMGTGSAANAVAARVRRLGLTERVRMLPHESDREALASAYRSARCVVMPGELETFGLVAFEAAASGASTVACETAPSARLLGSLVHTFAPGDPRALLDAIEDARESEQDRLAAARFAAANRWERAFAAELADLEPLVAR